MKKPTLKRPRISIIAAVASNKAIGKNNQLLWHIPKDLRRFKKLTTSHVVIMGQKTFESIGQPLPKRINIVLTQKTDFQPEDCLIAHSLENALALATQHEPEEIFFIGGGQVYQQALPLADRLYLTVVEGEYEADTYFPDYSAFSKILSEKFFSDGQYRFSFKILERQN